MNQANIDGIDFLLANQFDQLSPEAFEKICKASFELQNEFELKAKFAFVLLMDSPSLKDAKVKKQFKKLLKKDWSQSINIPVKNADDEYVILQTLSTAKTSRFNYILTELYPACEWIIQSFRSEEYYLVILNESKPIDLNHCSIEKFISISNILGGDEKEAIGQSIELVYNATLDVPLHVQKFVFVNIKKWYANFTSRFPYLFPTRKKEETETEEESEATDWNKIIVYSLPPEHFGKISDRMNSSAFDILYYLDQEIQKPKQS